MKKNIELKTYLTRYLLFYVAFI